MSYVYAEYSVPDGVTLDLLISKILEEFPNARITTEDWYARRRQEEVALVERLKKNGSSISNVTIETIDEAAKRYAQTRGILIPMDDNKLDGRISIEGFLLHSNMQISDRITKRLMLTLRSIGITTEIEVYNESPPWAK